MHQVATQGLELLITLQSSSSLGQIPLLDKHGGAFATDREAELVVRPMLYGVLWILAAASRRAAYIPLFRDAARQHRPQLRQLVPQLLNFPLFSRHNYLPL